MAATETVQVRDSNGNVARRTRLQWERLDKPAGRELVGQDEEDTPRKTRKRASKEG